MRHQLDELLQQYETGRVTRRDLLGTLALLVAAGPRADAAAAAPIGTVKQMNHVSIFVPDVKRSVAFYQDVLGLPLLTRQDPGINLNAGSGFLGIYPAAAGTSTGSINHVCFGVENFDADNVLKALTDRGIKANIRMRGETKELYFTDPDGVRVQLQDVKYIGGVGVLGDRNPG
jgi:catechol 2,3-dioxygenase-like lactoylglutathione lyase family enzyme